VLFFRQEKKMIDLKRNSRKELVPATGKRVRASSIYTPNQTETFKISRGKFSNFLTCQRCFYFDRVIGLDEPGTPGWSLNETTDILLKKEFDICREQQTAHRLFLEYKLDHLVPFKHPDINKWRDALHNGLMYQFDNSNIILTGGIDDIWQDTRDKSLIVVDYKSQANNKTLNAPTYLSDAYHDGYRTQMDFYAFLLQRMGFDVSDTSYFLVCNADRSAKGFYGEMKFSETLIPYKWNAAWIPGKVSEMINLMNSSQIPDAHSSCKNCAYAAQREEINSVDA